MLIDPRQLRPRIALEVPDAFSSNANKGGAASRKLEKPVSCGLASCGLALAGESGDFGFPLGLAGGHPHDGKSRCLEGFCSGNLIAQIPTKSGLVRYLCRSRKRAWLSAGFKCGKPMRAFTCQAHAKRKHCPTVYGSLGKFCDRSAKSVRVT